MTHSPVIIQACNTFELALDASPSGRNCQQPRQSHDSVNILGTNNALRGTKQVSKRVLFWVDQIDCFSSSKTI